MYEYSIFSLKKQDNDGILAELNTLGKEGWLVVKLFDVPTGMITPAERKVLCSRIVKQEVKCGK